MELQDTELQSQNIESHSANLIHNYEKLEVTGPKVLIIRNKAIIAKYATLKVICISEKQHHVRCHIV